MTWFAVYEKTNGRLRSTGTVVASDADLASRGLAKRTLAFNPQVPEKQWNETTKDFDTVVPPKPRTDAKGLFNRFTVAERDDIFDTAKTNKKVHGFIETMKLTDAFDPNDPDMIAAINRLETAGLIGAGRAAEILV